MPPASVFLGVAVQFSVTYEDGIWVFSVSSLEGEPEYLEEFEITNLGDARSIAEKLVEEIRDLTEEDMEEEDDEDDDYEDELDIFDRDRS